MHGQPTGLASAVSLPPLKYWFSKIEEWKSHNAPIMNSVLSPDGQYLATLGQDETLRIWNLFEKVEEDLDDQICPSRQSTVPRRSLSRKKFEKQDSNLIQRSLQKSNTQAEYWKLHAQLDLPEQV